MERTIPSEPGLGFTRLMKSSADKSGPPLSMTDEQAMELVQRDDEPKAFALLVRRWEKPILGLCARMLGDAHRAEDLKQEAFSHVFESRKEFQIGAKFSTWIWRIALNLCFDELRRTKRRAKHLQEGIDENAIPSFAPDPQAGDSPYLCVVRNEEGEMVRQALSQLDEKLRSVIVLRYCQGLKFREIADLLELPAATVQSRIATGLARLTRILHPSFASMARRQT